MKKEDWEKLKNFSYEEKDIFGRPIGEMSKGGVNYAGIKVEPILFEVMKRLDAMTSYAKEMYGEDSYCIVHDIANGLHSHPQSQHYKGRAVDYHIEGLFLDDMFFLAAFFGFRGIYYYPGWHPKGIHADIRAVGKVWGYKTLQDKYVTTATDFRGVIEI